MKKTVYRIDTELLLRRATRCLWLVIDVIDFAIWAEAIVRNWGRMLHDCKRRRGCEGTRRRRKKSSRAPSLSYRFLISVPEEGGSARFERQGTRASPTIPLLLEAASPRAYSAFVNTEKKSSDVQRKARAYIRAPLQGCEARQTVGRDHIRASPLRILFFASCPCSPRPYLP
jgi:hypothetical protein